MSKDCCTHGLETGVGFGVIAGIIIALILMPWRGCHSEPEPTKATQTCLEEQIERLKKENIELQLNRLRYPPSGGKHD